MRPFFDQLFQRGSGSLAPHRRRGKREWESGTKPAAVLGRAPWNAAVCLLLLSGSAFGCRNQAQEGAAEAAAAQRRAMTGQSPTMADDMTSVTDRLDRRVHFATAPQRIISLTPSTTEVLFAIGAGQQIVGATKYCNYPPAAEALPRVGGGTLESINQEEIVALQPDLVLCKWDNHQPLLRNLERLGIPVLAIGLETLADLYQETKMLGEVTGKSPQAEALVESMQRRVAAVAERVPVGVRPKVFFQVWDEPLMTAGPTSFIGELLVLAGARNLFEDSAIRYPKVNPEVVVAGDPDVILAPSSHATPVIVESILTRPGWTHIGAVRTKRVYLVNGDKISRCGPRMVDALEEIAAALHPQQFPPPTSPAAEDDQGIRGDRQSSRDTRGDRVL